MIDLPSGATSQNNGWPHDHAQQHPHQKAMLMPQCGEPNNDDAAVADAYCHQQRAVQSSEPDSSDESYGMDLFGADFEEEIKAIEAEQAMMDANDDDYKPGDMDEDDDNDNEDIEQETCAVCYEPADESNSFPCCDCYITIHHYAECMKDHKHLCDAEKM